MAEVSKITVKIGADTYELTKGLDKAKKETSKFGDTVKKIGGLIAGAFAVSTVINFAKESTKLAGEDEGIRTAYLKLDGTKLDDLRKSVQGTVSDMELMRNTVVAATLGLEASRMPELFAFAAKRANETGESVQFLVDSIVKGIGRKSPLILDNLGISAIALKEALGGVSMEAASVADVTDAVAKIARQATGDITDLGNAELTSAQISQQFNAELDNLKVAFGNMANEVVNKATPSLTEFTKRLTFLIDNKDIIFSVILGLGHVPQISEAEKQTKSLQGAWDIFKDTLKDTPDIESIVVADPIISLMANIKELTSGPLKEYNDFIKEQVDLYAKRNGVLSDSEPKLAGEKKSIEGVTEAYMKMGEIAQGIQAINADSIKSFEDFANAVIDSVKRIIGAKIAEAVTSYVAQTLIQMSWTGPGALAFASAAGLGANALFQNIIPSFANEGFISKPTMAMVGDAPGGEGEFVLRQSTVKNMANAANGGNFRFVISGRDLVAISEQYGKRKNTYN